MPALIVRKAGLCDYTPVWHAMQAFTEQRDDTTPDEIWFVQHYPVFTLGRNASEQHLLSPGAIPVVKTDRGGQVTYHGPGQLMAYLLIDIQRKQTGVRQLVSLLENSVIDMLAEYGVNAMARRDAPGVYVDNAKTAALGLRIRKGKSYHGLSLNVDMDLEPFSFINPCGMEDLAVTQTRTLGGPENIELATEKLLAQLMKQLGHGSMQIHELNPEKWQTA